ncbi:MAG: pilus assembly protein N-terminal domain-containing protein, partial [Planctomycetota bacterium]|nr:pilus assembly protein N-terminal domain-containing protein [Planctomycetota bacterium]
MNSLRRLVLALALVAPIAVAQEPERRLTVVQGAHARLVFQKDVQRVAVGNPETAGTIEISTRELLVLGKAPGQTTLIVWFAEGGHEERLVTVRRDLSLLRDALREIHAGISVEVAPDRDAVVLRGVVPDVLLHEAAERAALQYLESGPGPLVRGRADGAAEPAPGVQVMVGGTSGREGRRTAVINLLRIEHLSSLDERLAQAVRPVAGPGLFVRRLMLGQSPDDGRDLFVLEGTVHDGATLGRVLRLASRLVPADRLENLLRVDDRTPPAEGAGLSAYALEDRLLAVVRGVPGANVTVRRLPRGPVPDDAEDVFLLEGQVPGQVALVRLLTLAARVLGKETDEDDIRVVADEAGALRRRQGGGQGGGAGGGGGGGGG